MDIVTITTKSLSYLTFGVHILLGLYIIHCIGKKLTKKSLRIFDIVFDFVENKALYFAFAVALVSTLGSLFFSEVVSYTPCELCWFQRIFMYPQTVILGIALFLKKKDYVYYSLGLTIVGGAVSLYHNIGFIVKKQVNVCSAFGPSCFVDYFKDFGYIDISMMALTGFVLLGILSLNMLRSRNSINSI